MQDLTPEAGRRLDDIASRHGVSRDAALTLLRALAAGGGTMAQFSHPELGGMGQWSQGGMIMVGDMFNHGLKARVDALCSELSAMLREAEPFLAAAPPSPQVQSQGQADPGGRGFSPGGGWWPAELGAPASSGSQNDMHYAYFPAAQRLAVRQGGQLALYDTRGHQIFGVSQQQGGDQSLSFSSDRGTVRLRDLPQVGGGGGGAATTEGPRPTGAVGPGAPLATRPPADALPAAPVPAAASGSGDPLAMIERLAELHRKGILSEEEFTAKKAELLGRL